MKKSIDFTRILAIITIISVITSICLVAANASSGTVYEVESNSSASCATQTADDKDNYGTIDSGVDLDYWTIEFEEEGMANFWLGNIPTGCNYGIIILYGTSPSSTTILAFSDKSGKKAELVKTHVYPGYKYYVCVHSSDNTYDASNEYLLRIKNYPLDGGSINAKLFYADYTGYSTKQEVINATSQLWDMGFDAAYYNNNTVGPAYSVLPNTTIFVTANKGYYGQLYFHNSIVATSRTTLYAKPPSPLLSTDRAISNLSSSALNNVALAIYINSNSGTTHSTYGNMVDETLKKGAFVCIGWNCYLYPEDQNFWLESFFTNCTQHKNVYDVIDYLNDNYSVLGSYTEGLFSPYYGSNNLYSLSIN